LATNSRQSGTAFHPHAAFPAGPVGAPRSPSRCGAGGRQLDGDGAEPRHPAGASDRQGLRGQSPIGAGKPQRCDHPSIHGCSCSTAIATHSCSGGTGGSRYSASESGQLPTCCPCCSTSADSSTATTSSCHASCTGHTRAISQTRSSGITPTRASQAGSSSTAHAVAHRRQSQTVCRVLQRTSGGDGSGRLQLTPYEPSLTLQLSTTSESRRRRKATDR